MPKKIQLDSTHAMSFCSLWHKNAITHIVLYYKIILEKYKYKCFQMLRFGLGGVERGVKLQAANKYFNISE
jgi:hypothetical protein